MIRPVHRERLTKKFLMGLPIGVFLASSVGLAPGQPIFGEMLLALAERESQWKRIKELRVDGQLCDVFATAEDYIKYSLEGRYPNQRN